jgi:WD40 repeat protein
VVFVGAYRLYAYPAPKGGILVRRVADHRVERLLPGQAEEEVASFSPGGRFLAVRGEDSVLTVRRLADGRPVLRAPLVGRSSHTFGPDGRQLALGGAESVALFDLETGKERLRFPLPKAAHDLAWGDNGRLAVGHSGGATARVYDARTGALLAALPVGDMGNQLVAWHPDGERLAVAGANDSPIQVWDVAARHRVASLAGHLRTVASLTFHPAGGLLAGSSWDGTVRLWEPATGREVLRLIAGRFHSPPRFSADGRWLGCVAEAGKVRLLEVAPGRAYRTLVGRRGAWVGRYHRGDFSPDSRLLAVGTEDGAAVWDVATGRPVAELPAHTVSPFFLGAPAALLTAGAEGLHRWPLGPGQLGPPRRLAGFALVSARLDRRALLGAAEKLLWVLDVRSGQTRQVTIADYPRGSDQLALSPDGRLAAIASADTFEHHGWPTGGVKVWDVRTGKLVRELLGTQTWATFSPDGRLVTSGPDEYTFHDVASWKVVRRIRRAAPDYPGQVAFSADGKLMALAIEPAVLRLEELATGQTVELEDPHGDRAGWIGFSPDGAWLAVVAPDNKCVHVWDLRLLRRRLAEVGLDWTWPALRPGPPPSAVPRFVVDAGELDPTSARRKAEEPPRPAFARREGEQPRQTIERASAALRGNPDDVEAYHHRGHAHEKLGDFARAVADFTEALQRRPEDAHFLACRGAGRLRLRHYQDGIADLERALTLKIAPAEAAAVCDRLAWLRVAGPADLRDARKALPLAERAVRLWAANADYQRTLALACYRLGRLDEARRAAQTSDARATRPSALTAYVQAMILHRRGEVGANVYFRQAEARARQAWGALGAGQKAALRALRNEAAVELAKPPPRSS